MYSFNECFHQDSYCLDAEEIYNMLKNGQNTSHIPTCKEFKIENHPEIKGWLLNQNIACIIDHDIIFNYHFMNDFDYDTLVLSESDYDGLLENGYYTCSLLGDFMILINGNDHYFGTIEYQVERALWKNGFGGPIHVIINCECGESNCPFNNKDYYYNNEPPFNLLTMPDKIPICKIKFTCSFY